MLKKFLAITAIFIITLSGLSGCGETTHFLGGATEQENNTVKSAEIFIPIEKIRTLNPVISKDEDAYYVNKLIYEGLFGLDKNLALTNVLADSYTYLDDGYAATIKVKRGVYWQDGKELTAEDVKFTMDVIASSSYSNSTLYSNNLKNVKYTKLDNNDPYSITIYFINNNNVAMSNFTFPIIPRHQFKSVDAAKNTGAGFIPVGTGPYEVTEYNELSHIILKGYQQYHGGNVPANTVNLEIIPKRRDAINLMDVNKISLTFSKDIDRDTIYSNKDVNIINFPSNEVELIGYNFRNTALKDAKVRKAIACVIDTEEIIESAYYKNGVQNDNIYYPNFLGVDSKKTHNLLDVAQAKKLLTEAGYIDRNGDGLVENASNESITINILVNSEDQSRIAAAQIIKEGLAQLSIKSYITSKDWNGYNTDLAGGHFDIYLGGYQIKENYDLRFLLHTNYGNLIGYSNIALDALLDRMESGIAPKDRLATYTQIKDILTADLPYYCLLYKTYGVIVSPTLKGEIRPSFFDLYQGCQNWYSLYELPAEPEEATEADPNNY